MQIRKYEKIQPVKVAKQHGVRMIRILCRMVAKGTQHVMEKDTCMPVPQELHPCRDVAHGWIRVAIKDADLVVLPPPEQRLAQEDGTVLADDVRLIEEHLAAELPPTEHRIVRTAQPAIHAIGSALSIHEGTP